MLPVVLVVLVKLVGLDAAAAQTADVSVDDLVHCNQKTTKKLYYFLHNIYIQEVLSVNFKNFNNGLVIQVENNIKVSKSTAKPSTVKLMDDYLQVLTIKSKVNPISQSSSDLRLEKHLTKARGFFFFYFLLNYRLLLNGLSHSNFKALKCSN